MQVFSQPNNTALSPALFAPIIYPVEANTQLLNKEINEIVQDEQGFIWLGTRNGLFRYDGFEYKKMYFTSDKFDFDNIYVRALMVDGISLWVGSMSDGMFKLDLTTYQVTQYLHDENDKNSISGNQVNDFTMKASGDFWVATSFGLDKFNKKTNNFSHYRSAEDADDRYFNYLLDTELDSHGNLWLATGNGLAKFSERTGTFKRKFINKKLKGVTIRKIFLAKDKRLWLGTQKKGSFIVSSNGDQITRLAVEDEKSLKINVAITQVNDKEIWIAGMSGIEVRNADSGELTKVLKAKKQDDYSINKTSIYAIFTDKSGLTWLGVRHEGLRLYNGNNNVVRRMDNYHPELEDFFDSFIDGVVKLSTNQIILIKNNKSVIVHLVTGKVTPLQYFDNDILSSFPKVIKLDDNRLILGSSIGELFYYTLATGKFEKINVDFDNPLNERISRLTLYDENKLWFAKTNHLFLLNLDNGKLIQATTDNNKLFQTYIRSVTLDSKNRLWLATTSGVGLIEAGETSVTMFTKEKRTQGTLANNYILHVVENNQGDIFVNTSSGISQLKEQTASALLFEPFAQQATNKTTQRNKLYFANDNTAWFGPNFRLNSAGQVLNELTLADGILPHGRGKSIFSLNEQQLLFSYSNQINIIKPSELHDKSFIPRIAVTELMIDNKPLAIGNQLTEVSLTAENTSFSLRFSALDFSSMKSNRYRYKLEGLDERWQETLSEIRQVKYNSLSPGSYNLYLDASDKNGRWLTTPYKIKVTVSPKYFQTLWFKLLIIALFISFIYLLFKWRLTKVRKAEREAYEKREAINKAEC